MIPPLEFASGMPITAKLQQFVPLSETDRHALDRFACERVRHFTAREDVLREGDDPRFINLILSGWACRYKQLGDGRRQIIAFLLPGDLCDHNIFLLREMDHSLGTLAPVTLAEISRETFETVTHGHPALARAFNWETLVNAAIQREWTMNLGQRDAFERMAHLFCELFHRLHTIGLAEGDSYHLPLTQVDLADATAMTPVHVNRTLQELRARGLLELKRRRLTIPDLAALEAAALFTPNYLHRYRRKASQNANAA